ncbi:MAG: hypothetical protein ACLUPG_19245 [Roseburia faecis]
MWAYPAASGTSLIVAKAAVSCSSGRVMEVGQNEVTPQECRYCAISASPLEFPSLKS